MSKFSLETAVATYHADFLKARDKLIEELVEHGKDLFLADPYLAKLFKDFSAETVIVREISLDLPHSHNIDEFCFEFVMSVGPGDSDRAVRGEGELFNLVSGTPKLNIAAARWTST